MWAHGTSHYTFSQSYIAHSLISDLEKRQNLFRSGVLKPLPPNIVTLEDGTQLTLRPVGTGLFSSLSGKAVQSGMNDLDIPGALLEAHDETKEPAKEESSSEKISGGWEKL